MRLSDFDYDLPPDLIAQHPVPRGESRLLVLNRFSGEIAFQRFPALLEHLNPGDTLVLNDSRVSARRVAARLSSGADAEALLTQPVGEDQWAAIVRPGRRLKPGSSLNLLLSDGSEVRAQVTAVNPDGTRLLKFDSSAVRDRMANEGLIPLPPYIHEALEDEERYQTVYSREDGSAAAPTAGLHFTNELLDEAKSRDVAVARVTLHVGIDTFRPVRADDVREHVMHGEQYTLSEEAAEVITGTSGRVVAVGTTSVRVLESAAVGPQVVQAGSGVTRLFITPGYEYKVVQGILTNFHFPKSTLLMLVSAFAGRESVLAAYRAAVEARFRFYSFGDAMLIL